MKNMLKKGIAGGLNIIMFFLRNKKKKASLMEFASKILMNKTNEVEYDPDYDMYWLKDNGEYLYIVPKPYFNFSKDKLFASIERIACQYYIPKKGDVILDIGAGIGTETLYFYEKTAHQGQIYSVEASAASHSRLESLCKKNKIDISENLHLAITDSNQKVWIEESDTYQVDAVNKEAKGIAVDGVTLDHLITERNIHTIDFLKVNIEGSELQMIEGMQKAIKITKNIAVSCHDFLFDDQRNIKKTMAEFLENNGFLVTYNTTGHEVVDSWIYGTQEV
ncbi:FkbM family methyltransferase [Aquimarina sp. TRL1]|uniref:FkbM family methyltransferase n=1 Tax=Aquimarina sp. (strain TRL1) TaxID=2736252 RepID=UPI00158F5E8C|nr:FkbM family methyltransferase [Aquimarina sp. TRL1]QKX03915.1 FkbM family methyltransferase [Aquimarina sp. TRL1]